MTHAAGAAGNQNGLTIHRAIGEYTSVCGHYRDSQTGTDLKAYVIGKRRRAATLYGDILGCSAKSSAILRLIDPDSFPDFAIVDASTDSLDDTGTIAMWNDETIIEQVGKRARPFFHVRRIDTAGHQADQHFTLLWVRSRLLADEKHVCRRTKLLKPCRSHSLYPSVLIEPVRQRLRMSVQADRLSGYFGSKIGGKKQYQLGDVFRTDEGAQ